MSPISTKSLFSRLFITAACFVLLGIIVISAMAGVTQAGNGPEGTPSYLPLARLDPTATVLPSPTPAGIPQIIREIPIPQAGCPTAATVNPFTGWLYVANNGNYTLSILDSTQHLVTLPAGEWPSHLSADPFSPRTFLTNLRDATFAVYEYSTYITETATFGEPYDILYNPLTNYIYTSDLLGHVNVFDGTTYQLVADLDLQSGWILGMAMDTNTGLVYAANFELGKVFTFDGPATVGSVQAGWGVETVAVNPNNGYVYAAHSGPNGTYPNNISVIKDNQLVYTATTAVRSMDVAVNPNTGLAYFTNKENDTVTIVAGAQVLGNINVGDEPFAVEVNPVTGYVFVANRADDTVSIIYADAVVATYDTGDDPVAIAVDVQRNYTYIVSRSPDGGGGCTNEAVVTVLQ